jgi:hypothetical protein
MIIAKNKGKKIKQTIVAYYRIIKFQIMKQIPLQLLLQ